MEYELNEVKFDSVTRNKKTKTMETKKKTIGDQMHGKSREYIPNSIFRMMTLTMKTMDVFAQFSNKHFKTLGLKKNQIVVDYGCGPARYIKNASQTVGKNGKVYAVDIHPMAIEHVEKIISKYGLENVESVLAEGYSCSLPDKTSDVVYALDMFHMIENHSELLRELARIVKPDGKVIIEDGHQPRKETLAKINKTGIFSIVRQNKYHVVCSPKN